MPCDGAGHVPIQETAAACDSCWPWQSQPRLLLLVPVPGQSPGGTRREQPGLDDFAMEQQLFITVRQAALSGPKPQLHTALYS